LSVGNNGAGAPSDPDAWPCPECCATSGIGHGMRCPVGSGNGSTEGGPALRENAASKARRLLSEGRVTITRVNGPEVDAIVHGDSGFYLVRHRPGWWSCPCDAIGALCSHVQAVRLVTAPVGPLVLAPDLMVGSA
jgi:hypothetical protein